MRAGVGLGRGCAGGGWCCGLCSGELVCGARPGQRCGDGRVENLTVVSGGCVWFGWIEGGLPFGLILLEHFPGGCQ